MVVEHLNPIPSTIEEWSIHSALTEAGRRGIIAAHNVKLREMYRMMNTIPEKQIYWSHKSPGLINTYAQKAGSTALWASRNRVAIGRTLGFIGNVSLVVAAVDLGLDLFSPSATTDVRYHYGGAMSFSAVPSLYI